jgi:hypothetical protein
MRSCGFLVALTVMTGLVPAAQAQGVMPTAPDQGMPGGAYALPQVIPPEGGCVWNNATFSDGAVIERQQLPRAAFRCVRGSWRSFDTFDAARAGHELEPVAPPPPPNPPARPRSLPRS